MGEATKIFWAKSASVVSGDNNVPQKHKFQHKQKFLARVCKLMPANTQDFSKQFIKRE